MVVYQTLRRYDVIREFRLLQALTQVAEGLPNLTRVRRELLYRLCMGERETEKVSIGAVVIYTQYKVPESIRVL